MIAYKSERVTIYHADSLAVLPLLSTGSVDLIIADPPYGKSFNSNYRSERFGVIKNDTTADRDSIKDVLRECVRIVRDNRHLYVFGPVDVLAGLKVSKATDLIWDKGKTGMGDLSLVWGPAHEPISFVVSRHHHVARVGKDALPARLRKGSVLHFNSLTGRNVRHPNEKPVELLRELIESSTRSGETVLDPYAGIASTAVASVLSGRRAVLVEIDDKWLPIAIERVQAAERIADAMQEVT